ncbi:hypothetical protein ACXYMX_07345 [Sporosarcina sp. CAU 1771]
MEYKSIEEQVIQKYQEDEQIMIQLFIKWCFNHELDPIMLYKKAYPEQLKNPALLKALEEFDTNEQMDITNETILDILQMFGNDDLAFIVSDEIEHIAKKQSN